MTDFATINCKGTSTSCIPLHKNRTLDYHKMMPKLQAKIKKLKSS